jgi:hypothetical protein
MKNKTFPGSIPRPDKLLRIASYRIDVSVGILVDPDPGGPGAGRRPFAVAPDDTGASRLVRPGAGIVELKFEGEGRL